MIEKTLNRINQTLKVTSADSHPAAASATTKSNNAQTGGEEQQETTGEKISGDEHWNRWQAHNKNKIPFVSNLKNYLY